jgi:hypothetical protein
LVLAPGGLGVFLFKILVIFFVPSILFGLLVVLGDLLV